MCNKYVCGFLHQVSVEGNIGCGKSTLLSYFESCPTVQVGVIFMLDSIS